MPGLSRIATKAFDTEDDADWNAIWHQGTRCLALDLAGKAKAATRTFIGEFDWSKIELSDLPPNSGCPSHPSRRAR